MTKSKTSTIAIVVLSVLLAAALAATIVLAAFTASGRASTTITFGEGLTLTLSGTDVATGANSNTVTLTAKDGLTAGGTIYSNALVATPSRDAKIAYKPTATVSSGFTAGAATNGTNAVTWTITNTSTSGTITLTMAYTGASWDSSNSCLTINEATTAGVNLYDTISVTADNANDLAGLTITFAITIGAVSADGEMSEAITVMNA